ncbi:hypothetical protein [Anaerovirgula multivorans]|nr:hypothetical protein [Anaerovirgula multivorans]
MATYAVTSKHYRIIGIVLLIIGFRMSVANITGLIEQVSNFPKEMTVAGDFLFQAQSAGKYTIKTRAGSSTSKKTKYSIHYESVNGQYELNEALPEGTAIIQSQLAGKQTKRTVFTFGNEYYVGRTEEMTPEQGLKELKKSVIDDKIPLVIIGIALFAAGIWFQFVANSRKKTGPIEKVNV